MSVKTEAAKRPRVRTKQPTSRDFVLTYGGAGLGTLLLASLAWAFDWSRGTFLVSAVVFVAIYVPLAVSFLFARSERRLTARP